MKIIILGAGQVGASLAEALIQDNHDVTMVDSNAERLQSIQEKYDLRAVRGHCSYPNILRQAGAEEADMLIAVTDNDETNMIACQVAYSLFHVPKKIARIRSQHYLIREELFDEDHLPINVFISPEQILTKHVEQLLQFPGALQVLDFAQGNAKMVAVKAYYGGEAVGKTVERLRHSLDDVALNVVAIYRDEKSMPISDDAIIEVGDEVFFVADTKAIKKIMSLMRLSQDSYRSVMIGGAGRIGSALAMALENNYRVKVVDHNRHACERLAERLDSATVLCGELSDQELLSNENVEKMDVYCAVTDDDEANIIGCLQVKRLGVKNVMALISRTAYVDLIEAGSINIAISPQKLTVGTILAHLRQGDIVNVYSLRHGSEAIEVVAHGTKESSKVVGRPLDKIKFPKSTVFGAIVRGEEVIVNLNDVVIEQGDHVILFVKDNRRIRDVERLFQVGATFI